MRDYRSPRLRPGSAAGVAGPGRSAFKKGGKPCSYFPPDLSPLISNSLGSGALLYEIEPYCSKHDLVSRIPKVETQAEKHRAFFRVNQRWLAVYTNRPGGIEMGWIIQKDNRCGWRVLDLCQPRLTDEAARGGIIIAAAHADDLETRRDFEPGFDNLVSSAFGFVTES